VVYIDPTGIVYDASLNQTNVGHNNNKFYRLQLLESRQGNGFIVWTRWGRVGAVGQNKPIPCISIDSALAEFNTKFKQKSGLQWVGHSRIGNSCHFHLKYYTGDVVVHACQYTTMIEVTSIMFKTNSEYPY
jgi:predicted DNA-binding WGR domain protein